MRCFVVASAALIWAGLAAAQDVGDVASSFRLDDGADLVTVCTVSEDEPLHDTAKGFCLGYMSGAMQLYRAATASPDVPNAVCTTGEVSRAEMRRIFLAWAEDHPELLDEPAIDALLRAAVAAFPCS
jgi:hypothetical protein